MYVIFKEFGNYRFTSKTNYDAIVRNADVIILHNCNSYKEALQCVISAGFTEENIINKTGE